MALHALNLCDGYGGFSLALASFGVRTVARVERDSYAAAVLVERMAQARLDQCPIWDDLTTFDGAAWRGRVHIVTAGLPCQPFSAAGERRGVDDDRHLWPYMRRIVADVAPEFVILENVPGFVRGGLPEVLGDLARLGFDAEWGLLSAADVGAPHRRERFWLVGHAQGIDEREPHRQACTFTRADARADVGRRQHSVADTQDDRLKDAKPWRHKAEQSWPPNRDNEFGWRRWINEGGPQPVLRRLTDGPPSGLADALHLGGNGLVPQAATEAIRQLLQRGGWTMTSSPAPDVADVAPSG